MSINYDVILSPVITEKATRMTEANQVVFRVTLDATKPAIAKAVADLFKVKVKAVNTIIVKGKRKAARGKVYTRSDTEHDLAVLGRHGRLFGDHRRQDDVVMARISGGHFSRASSASSAARVRTSVFRRRMS